MKNILKLNFSRSSGSIIFTLNFPQLATPSILLCKHLAVVAAFCLVSHSLCVAMAGVHHI